MCSDLSSYHLFLFLLFKVQSISKATWSIQHESSLLKVEDNHIHQNSRTSEVHICALCIANSSPKDHPPLATTDLWWPQFTTITWNNCLISCSTRVTVCYFSSIPQYMNNSNLWKLQRLLLFARMHDRPLFSVFCLCLLLNEKSYAALQICTALER